MVCLTQNYFTTFVLASTDFLKGESIDGQDNLDGFYVSAREFEMFQLRRREKAPLSML
jgi:hypothetical protein